MCRVFCGIFLTRIRFNVSRNVSRFSVRFTWSIIICRCYIMINSEVWRIHLSDSGEILINLKIVKQYFIHQLKMVTLHCYHKKKPYPSRAGSWPKFLDILKWTTVPTWRIHRNLFTFRDARETRKQMPHMRSRNCSFLLINSPLTYT